MDDENGLRRMKCFILGTRPEWIHLRGYLDYKPVNEDFVIINTGQHKDYRMASAFASELRLPEPAANLNSSPLRFPLVLRRLERILPSLGVTEIFVIGDTNSALAGALAAHSARIRLTHIEAGLRCDEPIPEEYNRRCVDALSDVLLAPEDYAVENLKREHTLGHVIRTPNYKVLLFRRLTAEVMRTMKPAAQEFSLLSLHRQENVDDRRRLERILAYLERKKSRILWPVHPRTASKIKEFGIRIPANIMPGQPLSYRSMIERLIEAKTVYTDSGGVVLEAYELGKPLVVFRKSIEWRHVQYAPTTTTY